MVSLAPHNPRYGYRRIWARLRRKRVVNRKRVHRLWKRARLHIERQKRRRTQRERPTPLIALRPNQVWAYDFLEDRDRRGNTLHILTVMDEFTREGLSISVATTMTAEQVIRSLAPLLVPHGAPNYVRSDNGPEFVALAIQTWLAKQQITTRSIEKGCPWQHGKEERFNGTVRDECLNMHLFASVAEAALHLEAFRRHYNDERPHSALGYKTPSEFKFVWFAAHKNGDDPNIPT